MTLIAHCSGVVFTEYGIRSFQQMPLSLDAGKTVTLSIDTFIIFIPQTKNFVKSQISYLERISLGVLRSRAIEGSIPKNTVTTVIIASSSNANQNGK